MTDWLVVVYAYTLRPIARISRLERHKVTSGRAWRALERRYRRGGW